MPHVTDPNISDDKRGEEPVSPMNKVVVIKVVVEIFKSYFTIIIVRMHTFGNFLVKPVIKESKKPSPISWSVVQKHKNHAEVYQ